MGSLARKFERLKEKDKIQEIKTMYGKKPKQKCPKCHQKTLFFTNNEGNIYCVRCDKQIGIKK